MKLSLSFCASLLCLFVFGTNSLAAPQQSFQQWLEHYRAWDRLEKEYAAEKTDETPQDVLKRAQVYLNLNSPAQALEIIEMTAAFDDKKLEAERLWIGGQAFRGLGDLSKAVLWFTQATRFMDASTSNKRLKAEPQLETIWHDVWLKMYWSYTANHTLSRASQKEALLQVLSVGQQVWKDSFWDKAQVLLEGKSLQLKEENKENTEVTLAQAPFLSVDETNIIAQSMASVSLSKFEAANKQLDQLSLDPVRFFWKAVVLFLENGTLPADLAPFISGNYLKAHAFWAGNMLAPYSTSKETWFLGNPHSGPWNQFKNNLLAMPLDDANKAIDNELRSMLISEQTTALLSNFKLALTLSNGDFSTAKNVWNSLNKRTLPISLQLAGLLSFKENLNNVLPSNPTEAYALSPILTALSGAAGHDIHPLTEAPFWMAFSPKELAQLSNELFPLDKLLLLAHWQKRFEKKPSQSLAKRAAFLFENASFGIQGLLYLANDAAKAKHLQLSAFYLNKIEEPALPANLKVSWLDIKTRIELNAGRQGAALQTYQDMVATGEPIPVMTRLRMALLYQQRKDYKTAQKELLAMWDVKESMTTALQAETLFWLGEGEYGMRHPEKALDYYLKLAWQYPKENIWALTAMYRAALIYEKRGKYDTAKRLLGTVVRNAGRKEQREAAKARIDAIEKKSGTKKASTSALVYPF
ncbi:tetratricopeptide repeat protein [Pseudodesulfovibrio sp. JC047]|uniref:tetratricopeptide repeat protein n=1 Tax=Pseudodesulfovibrio sp. JC047 TaxID=2683199 RepID=UPI0013D32D65|nr:tetratricopeptide repeat protein [Pseudodesulfovibrio sp. JC047]NDV19127.1 tetratricopeptide repeat protein [Pseudodesulfovibrio sp. JC047]